MTADQQKGWGWGAIVLGGLVLLLAANQSGQHEARTTRTDAWINTEIDRRNNWQPGTTDKLYQPGSTHRYSRRETPVGLLLTGAALIAAGVWILNAGKPKPGAR